MKTLAITAALLAMALGPGLARGTGLPERNLLVEIRTVESTDRDMPPVGQPAGGFSVGTAGGVNSGGGVTVRAGSRQQMQTPVQRVPVLNGHRASVRLMESVPLQWFDSASTPKGQVSAVHQQWTEAGTAFSVLPRWPGGSSPVSVDIEHLLVTAPDGASGARHESLVTTIRLPMNEWETIAQDGGGDRSPAEANTVSTRDVGGRRRHLLQIRVSAP